MAGKFKCAKSQSSTMWKFQDFCITEILREINFVDSRSAKSDIFAILGAVNFVHLANSAFKKCKNSSKSISEPFNVLKWQSLHF